MPNMGLGIGSFIQGLTNGVNISRQWDKDEQDQKFRNEQLKLLQNQDQRATAKDARDASNDDRRFGLLERQDARSAEKDKRDAADTDRRFNLLEHQDQRAADAATRSAANDTQDRQWKTEDRARDDADRAANKPIEDLKRKSVLGTLTSAEDERQAKKDAGEAANKAVQSGEFGNYEDAWNKYGVDHMQKFYLSHGDTTKADGIKAWSENKNIQGAIKKVGDVDRAFASGDWDGGIARLNAALSDKSYIPDDGWKRSAEPLKSNDGKTIGIRITTTGPNGETSSHDSTDIGEVHNAAMSLLDPKHAFEYGKSVYDASIASKQEQAKSNRKLASDIELENAKTRNALTLEGAKGENALDVKRIEIAGRIAEERAKAGGPQAVKDYANGVLQVMKFQSENNTGFAKLPADQQAEQAAQIYEQVRARSGQGGAPATPAVPTSRTMAPPAAAPGAPLARSIMPQFAQPGPFVPET